MNPRLISVLIRVILPALVLLVGWSGRKMGLFRPKPPPVPDHDVGARPLKSALPPLGRGGDSAR